MDELVDILDAQGRPTGECCLKSEAHRRGLLHPTVHVWFFTKDAKILVQQRGRFKDTHPLLWDVSVAGHVGSGESIRVAAIREVREEIGLEIAESDLMPIGASKTVHRISRDFVDAEFQHLFLCELRVPLKDLTKQKSEVESLELLSLLKFAEESWGMAKPSKYVPHGPSYYKKVIQEIKNRI